MALIDTIKGRLLTSSSDRDTDIAELINEAKADLIRAGVVPQMIIDTDVNIIRAIWLYCRTYFDLHNPIFDQWLKCYESARDWLANDGGYNGLGS